MGETPEFVLERLPETDDELYWLVKALWGVTIPRNSVCPDHIPPFEVFADAFFNRGGSISLWHGSRGLSGKSFMLSILGITKAFLKGADVNLLGGSLAQSTNIHEHMRSALESGNSPRYMIETESQTMIKLSNGARIRPLTASQKTVRGPHPPFLLLDEIDEMDIDILDAALGQPMPQKNYLGEIIPAYTVLCSTWQNPEGTFTEVRRRFEERGLPIKTWCVAQDSLVATARGEVPIQEVLDSDLVLTRNGFRHVQHVTFMGYKPTIELNIGDKSLRVTGDHLIATPTGWSDAHALATDTMSSIRPNPDVLLCELVPFPTMSSAGLVPPSTGFIDSLGNQIQVLNVDTTSVATQMINSEPIIDRPNDAKPDPSMSLDSSTSLTALNVFDSVAVALTSRPVDAVSGEHGIMLPVWDIGVEGDDHEFVANGVLVHNCYRESANPIDGWLTQETIEAKKQEISAEMWRVEYELGEPSIGNRAFDADAVEATFSLEFSPLFKKESKDFEEYVFEEPDRTGRYVAAADWAKEQDYTVITVLRVDTYPKTLVYFLKVHRRPYPVMVGYFNDAINKYNAQALHDRTGLGNVVNDYLDIRAQGFTMTGEKRASMLAEYVSAVERGEFHFPKIRSAYISHKYCRVGDLYSNTSEYHLPDDICSFALAFRASKRYGPPVSVLGVPKRNEPNRYERLFTATQEPTIVSVESAGEVRQITGDNEYTLLL